MLNAGPLSCQQIATGGKRGRRNQFWPRTAAKGRKPEFQYSGVRDDYSVFSTKFLNDSMCLRVSFLNAPGIRNAMILM